MKKTFKQVISELKKMHEIYQAINGIEQFVRVDVMGNGIEDVFDGHIEQLESWLHGEYIDEFVNLLLKVQFDGEDTGYIEDKDGYKYSVTLYLHP